MFLADGSDVSELLHQQRQGVPQRRRKKGASVLDPAPGPLNIASVELCFARRLMEKRLLRLPNEAKLCSTSPLSPAVRRSPSLFPGLTSAHRFGQRRTGPHRELAQRTLSAKTISIDRGLFLRRLV